MDLSDLPLGWQTDLGVLEAGGALLERRGDHLLVRTPHNPTYHWGHFVLVTDPGAADDVERWRTVFAEAFPGAEHFAIGFLGEPAPARWTEHGEIEHNDVLVADGPLSTRELPEGYQVRILSSQRDWDTSTVMRDFCYPGELAFEQQTTRTRQELGERELETWFAAFTADGEQAAELGIAGLDVAGPGLVARYRSVLTHPEHRRRGLTSHLLGVAAEHARSRGAQRLVIVADADSDAGRLYLAAGFRHAETLAQVYRKPVS